MSISATNRASLVAQMMKRLPAESDPGSIPGLGKSPGVGNGNPLQDSCLGKSHGQRSLVGYSPWGRKESDMTEWLNFLFLSLTTNMWLVFRFWSTLINTLQKTIKTLFTAQFEWMMYR